MADELRTMIVKVHKNCSDGDTSYDKGCVATVFERWALSEIPLGTLSAATPADLAAYTKSLAVDAKSVK